MSLFFFLLGLESQVEFYVASFAVIELGYSPSVIPWAHSTTTLLPEENMNIGVSIVGVFWFRCHILDHLYIDVSFQELEAAVFHDFRLDIMKKLKRQSVKANVIREKLGLGVKPAHIRSHSMGTTPVFLAATTPPKKGSTRQETRRLISCRETDSENISPVNGNGHNRAFSVDFDVSQRRRRSESTPSAGNREPAVADDDPFAPSLSHYTQPKISLQEILSSSSDSDEADHEVAHIRKPLHR